MEIVAFLIPFVLLGGAVLFIAFTGGPSAAREAYLTGGGRLLRVVFPVLYIALGVGVPALILTARGEATGRTGSLQAQEISEEADRGKQLFRQQCASCHNLDAVNARGVTGPDLDEIGKVTPGRIAAAIRSGGTGQGRMPAKLLEGKDAREVARYVTEVAGK